MASVRSCQKLPLCQIEPISAISKTDPPLAKAEPISDGSASGMTYLRRGKTNWHNSKCRQRDKWECVRETALQTPRSVKKEGGGGAPDARAEIPLQPMEKTRVRQAVPMQSMEVHGGADIHQ